MTMNLPALPPGFELMEQPAPMPWPPMPSATPAPPPGFELVQPDQPSPAYQDAASAMSGITQRLGQGQENPLPQPVSTTQAAAQGIANMVTFGLDDEAAAAVGTLGGMLPGGHGKGYSQLLEEIRDENERGAEQHSYAHIAGQVAGGLGGGASLVRGGLSLAGKAAKAGSGWLARFLGAGTDGALALGAYGFGSGEGARDRVVDAASNLPLGFGLGVAGEGIATGAGALYRSAFRGAGDVAPGISPAANVETAGEFGIPLTRGQATRSVKQAGIEDQLRAQGALDGFDATQREAVAASVPKVQQQFANGRPAIPDASSAYEGIPGRLRAVRDELKEASQTRYNRTVDDPSVLVSGDAVRKIPTRIRNALTSDNIVIDPMYHQGAARALKYVDDYLARLPTAAKASDSTAPMLSGPAGELKSIDAQLRWIENLRAGLRKNFPAMGPDAPAIRAINNSVDDWMDDAFERGMVSGDEGVLAELKQARAKWSEYKSMAEPSPKIGGKLNPQYEAQRALRTIMDKDMSPEEIGRYLWGTSVASPKNTSFMTAQLLRKTLGPDSSEWSAVRQSFWLRATRAGDQELSPAKVAKNIDGLLHGDGKGVANTLYSKSEMDLMKSYAGVMRMLSLPKAGVNGSNTANRLVPLLRSYASNIVGALSAGGGLYGGLGPLEATGLGAIATAGGKGLGAIAKASRASTATRVPVPVNSNGYGSAMLRSAPMPALSDQRIRRPLEITVGRGRR